MKVKKKKHNFWWIYIIIALVIIISVPIIINIFAENSESNFFTPNDILVYCGTILSMSGAILGVFFSLRYSQIQYYEDTLKRVLPFITLQDFDCYEKDFFSAEVDKDIKRKRVYLIVDSEGFIDSGGFILEESLPDELKKKIDFNFSNESDINLKAIRFYPKILINVGIGTAVNCMLTACKANERDGWMASPIDFSILPGQKLYIGIYINGSSPKFKTEDFSVRIYYSDIYGTNYYQEWIFQAFSNGLNVYTSIRQDIEKNYKRIISDY